MKKPAAALQKKTAAPGKGGNGNARRIRVPPGSSKRFRVVRCVNGEPTGESAEMDLDEEWVRNGFEIQPIDDDDAEAAPTIGALSSTSEN